MYVAVPVHFDMTSYQAEEGDAFTPSIIVDRCYSGSFTINVMTADGSARGRFEQCNGKQRAWIEW